METLSFILGVSSVVGIVIAILAVVGYVKVGKVEKNLESFQNNIFRHDRETAIKKKHGANHPVSSQLK